MYRPRGCDALPTRKRAGRDVFLHGQSAGPALGFVAAECGGIARGGVGGEGAASLRYRRHGGVAGASACDMALATGGCGLPHALGVDQGGILPEFAQGGGGKHQSSAETRTGHLATALLGTPDPGRRRSRPACGLCALQPGETWLGTAADGLAIFHLASICKARRTTARLGKKFCNHEIAIRFLFTVMGTMNSILTRFLPLNGICQGSRHKRTFLPALLFCCFTARIGKRMKTKSALVYLPGILLSPLAAAVQVQVQYTYDDINRLTAVTFDSVPLVGYNYDAAGNIASGAHCHGTRCHLFVTNDNQIWQLLQRVLPYFKRNFLIA